MLSFVDMDIILEYHYCLADAFLSSQNYCTSFVYNETPFHKKACSIGSFKTQHNHHSAIKYAVKFMTISHLTVSRKLLLDIISNFAHQLSIPRIFRKGLFGLHSLSHLDILILRISHSFISRSSRSNQHTSIAINKK